MPFFNYRISHRGIYLCLVQYFIFIILLRFSLAVVNQQQCHGARFFAIDRFPVSLFACCLVLKFQSGNMGVQLEGSCSVYDDGRLFRSTDRKGFILEKPRPRDCDVLFFSFRMQIGFRFSVFGIEIRIRLTD